MTAAEHLFTPSLLSIRAETAEGTFLFRHSYRHRGGSSNKGSRTSGQHQAAAPDGSTGGGQGQTPSVGHLSFEFLAFFLKDRGVRMLRLDDKDGLAFTAGGLILSLLSQQAQF